MLRLKNPISPPVRNWWYDCPDGVRVVSSDPAALYRKALDHKVTEPYPEWYALMIDAVCRAIEPEACEGDDEGKLRTERVTFKKIKDGLTALTSVAMSAAKGEPVYASQQEADRRAAICLRCKHNIQVECTGCSGIVMIADVFLQRREVAGQAKLGSCECCGCYLSATCFASKEVLTRADKGHQFPSHCWRKWD